MWQNLLNAVTRILYTIAAYFGGRWYGETESRRKQAENALEKAAKALEAAARVRDLSDDDILRRLRERGMLRGVSDDKR